MYTHILVFILCYLLAINCFSSEEIKQLSLIEIINDRKLSLDINSIKEVKGFDGYYTSVFIEEEKGKTKIINASFNCSHKSSFFFVIPDHKSQTGYNRVSIYPTAPNTSGYKMYKSVCEDYRKKPSIFDFKKAE